MCPGTFTSMVTVRILGVVSGLPRGARRRQVRSSRPFPDELTASRLRLPVALAPRRMLPRGQPEGDGSLAIPGGKAFTFTPPDPIPEVQVIQDLELLPVALSAFLALLAVSAVGYALSMAVGRRRHDLAVLRALGITRRQARLVITTQASLLALIGLTARTARACPADHGTGSRSNATNANGPESGIQVQVGEEVEVAAAR